MKSILTKTYVKTINYCNHIKTTNIERINTLSMEFVDEWC